MNAPLIAISSGEPAGIGPEVAAATLADALAQPVW
jgi:4-hydroxy-L-threonine phosphate dehydrogenase PdxA